MSYWLCQPTMSYWLCLLIFVQWIYRLNETCHPHLLSTLLIWVFLHPCSFCIVIWASSSIQVLFVIESSLLILSLPFKCLFQCLYASSSTASHVKNASASPFQSSLQSLLQSLLFECLSAFCSIVFHFFIPFSLSFHITVFYVSHINKHTLHYKTVLSFSFSSYTIYYHYYYYYEVGIWIRVTLQRIIVQLVQL